MISFFKIGPHRTENDLYKIRNNIHIYTIYRFSIFAGSSLRTVDIDFELYTEKKLSDTFRLYWRILKEQKELEVVMVVNSTSYVALGWRPKVLTKSCKNFPSIGSKYTAANLSSIIQLNDTNTLDFHDESESEPKPENVQKSKTESEPENEVKNDPKSEPKNEPKSEPDTSTILVLEETTTKYKQSLYTKRSLCDTVQETSASQQGNGGESGRLVPQSGKRQSWYTKNIYRL